MDITMQPKILGPTILSAMVLAALLVPQSASGDGLTNSELAFVLEATRSGLTEIRLAEMAQQRASSQAVKSLAQRMLDEQMRADRELADIAQRKGVMLPTESGAELAGSAIASTTGEEFDRLFPAMIISAHQTDIQMFERLISEGSDLDIKNWATKEPVDHENAPGRCHGARPEVRF